MVRVKRGVSATPGSRTSAAPHAFAKQTPPKFHYLA